MKLNGQLAKNILEGKAVLFLGAGVGKAIGLHGTVQLSNYVFEKCGRPLKYEKYKDELNSLVSRLDSDVDFKRPFINSILKDYFLDHKNYKNLDLIERLLAYKWNSIITTNYDISLELVAQSPAFTSSIRLLPIRDPNDKILITNIDGNKLKYFKIHGCCKDLEENPSKALPLVITEPDFRARAIANKNVWSYLEGLAYHCSIIFIGFNGQKHARVIESIYEAQHNLKNNFQEPFKTYAVLKDVDEDTQFELEEFEIELLEGDFEDFIEAVENLHLHKIQPDSSSETAYYKIKNGNLGVINYLKDSLENLKNQFYTFYDGFFEKHESNFSSQIRERIVDSWRNQPTLDFIFSNRVIKRNQEDELATMIHSQTNDISKGSEKLRLFIGGERGCGKTVLVHRVLKDIYIKYGNPILMLNSSANYIDNINGKEIIVSGWNGRSIDKFLSEFDRQENLSSNIPIILIDNMFYKMSLVDNLERHLLNHGKRCLFIFTASIDEFNNTIKHNSHPANNYKIDHKLSDSEINRLFDVIMNDNLHLSDKKIELIARAKDVNQGNRDILLILFMWFDRNFRRLEDIIIEEAEKISQQVNIKDLYCSIALFQQYYLRPKMDLCAKALNISIKEFDEIKNNNLFKALITINSLDSFNYAETRHAEYTRRLVAKVMPDFDAQIDILSRVLEAARAFDVDFVRSFFIVIFQSNVSYSVEQITKLKEASENVKQFRDDYVLNHQFAAYLIRENADLDKAEYYLDLALETSINNPTLIHTKGNLQFARFRNSEDLENYNAAKIMFDRVRILSPIPEEHDYVTEIDLITYRIDNTTVDAEMKTILEAERAALMFEAVDVVPKEQQNYLSRKMHHLKSFNQIDLSKQKYLQDIIESGKASHLILKFYSDYLMNNKTDGNWNKLNSIVQKYFVKGSDIATLTVVGLISKKAFIITSEKRFEILRNFYDYVVRYKEMELSSVLLGEFIKLLFIDAFVLRKYEFLNQTVKDLRELLRYSFPRYMKDEYVLPNDFYDFDDEDKILKIKNFKLFSDFFTDVKFARRFKRSFNLNVSASEQFYNIELDFYSKFYIRGVKKEINSKEGRVEIDFAVKFAFDGFKVADPFLI